MLSPDRTIPHTVPPIAIVLDSSCFCRWVLPPQSPTPSSINQPTANISPPLGISYEAGMGAGASVLDPPALRLGGRKSGM